MTDYYKKYLKYKKKYLKLNGGMNVDMETAKQQYIAQLTLQQQQYIAQSVSYTHLRAHET